MKCNTADKPVYNEKEALKWVQGILPRYSVLIDKTAEKDKELAKLMLMAMDSFMANQFHLGRK